jgi:hypothetical protein
MAKGQQRGNREKRKPKSAKPKPLPSPGSPFSQSPIGTAAKVTGGKKKN